jgi:multiple sugar transport system permease protein
MTMTSVPRGLSLGTSASRSRVARGRRRTGMLMTLPLAILVFGLFVIPFILLIWIAFNHWPLLGASYPNGVANFAELADPLFISSIGFTLLYTVITTVILTGLALGLALLVQVARRGTAIIRTAILLPGAVGLAAACFLFYAQFVDPSSGLNSLTGGNVNWLGTTNSSLWSIEGMVIWRFAGFYMLVLLTGLQAIPLEVYEAARIDGANAWKTFRYVTLPLLRPTMALVLVLSITGSILVFEPFYIVTTGRPDNTTVSVVMTVVREAFTEYDLGRAAAISVILLFALLVINAIPLLAFRERPDRDR